MLSKRKQREPYPGNMHPRQIPIKYHILRGVSRIGFVENPHIAGKIHVRIGKVRVFYRERYAFT
jgi:hypothetical protein